MKKTRLLIIMALVLVLICLITSCNEQEEENIPTDENEASTEAPAAVCEHEFGETTVILAPTCEKVGIESKKCIKCGETITTTVLALEHTKAAIGTAKEASCTEIGMTAGVKCADCNYIFEAQQVIGIKHHTYDNDQDEDCNSCGYIRELNCLHPTSVTIPAVAATCTSTGLTEGSRCSKCGEILVEQEVAPTLEHTEKIIEAIEPTCTSFGMSEGKICSVCEKILVAQQIIPTIPHTEEKIEAIMPTCTKEGASDGKICSVCSTILVQPRVILALGHVEQIIEGESATCLLPGKTQGKKCSSCDEILVEQETIPMGHYAEKQCELCGKYILNGAHTFYKVDGSESIPLTFVNFKYIDAEGAATECTQFEYESSEKCLYFNGEKVYQDGAWLIQEQYITFNFEEVSEAFYNFILSNTTVGEYELSGKWSLNMSALDTSKALNITENISFSFWENGLKKEGASITLYNNLSSKQTSIIYNKSVNAFLSASPTESDQGVLWYIEFGEASQRVSKEFYTEFSKLLSYDCKNQTVFVGTYRLNDDYKEHLPSDGGRYIIEWPSELYLKHDDYDVRHPYSYILLDNNGIRFSTNKGTIVDIEEFGGYYTFVFTGLPTSSEDAINFYTWLMENSSPVPTVS